MGPSRGLSSVSTCVTIRKLTPEQEEFMARSNREWQANARSTEPVDLAACEELIRSVYGAHKQEAPKIELVDSPLSAAFIRTLWPYAEGHRRRARKFGAESNHPPFFDMDLMLMPIPGKEIWRNIQQKIISAETPSPIPISWVGDGILYHLKRGNLVSPIALEIIRKHTGIEVPTAMRFAVTNLMCRAAEDHLFYRMRFHPHPVRTDILAHGLKLASWKGFSPVVKLARLCAGWVESSQGILIFNRPQSISLDARDRLHNETGPALLYRDGFALHAWHGVRVPSFVIEDPNSITPEKIQREENSEVARIMLIRMGEEGFLSQFEAVGKPFRGSQLYMTRLQGNTLARVRAINSTAEPDGSFKVYWLRVPPDVSCAQEALARIHINPWRSSWKGYQPVVET